VKLNNKQHSPTVSRDCIYAVGTLQSIYYAPRVQRRPPASTDIAVGCVSCRVVAAAGARPPVMPGADRACRRGKLSRQVLSRLPRCGDYADDAPWRCFRDRKRADRHRAKCVLQAQLLSLCHRRSLCSSQLASRRLSYFLLERRSAR